MEERINRKDDQSLYQPKIHSERIRALYILKQDTGKPMTVLLDQAISDLTERYGAIAHLGDELSVVSVDEDTWEEICEYRRVLDELDYLKCVEELARIKKNEQGRGINQ